MNSVYIDSAVSASPIYIGPNNANSVIIGNANCKTTLVGGVKCNNYDRNNTAQELLIGHLITGPQENGNVIRIGENVTTGVIAIGNGYDQNGRITIGGSGNLARTIVIGSPSELALPIASIELNGKVTLQRPLILQPAANYVAPTADIMLGGITVGTVSTATTFARNDTFASLTLTQPGVYIMTFNLSLTTMTKGATNKVQLIGTSASPVPYGASNPSSVTMNWTGCQVFLATATEYKVMLFQTDTTFSTTPALDGYFTATRIA